MARVARHAFQFLTVLSLLLCAAICVLWVRSCWREDGVGFTRFVPGLTTDILVSNKGVMLWGRYARPLNPNTGGDVSPGWHHWHREPIGRPFILRVRISRGLPGIVYDARRIVAPGSVYHGTLECAVAVRYWLLLTAAGIWPAFVLFSSWKRSRAMRRAALMNVCHHCGYDLRASPDRCPECGTAPPRGKVPAR